ncbi:hypothetical protein LguiA_009636 [Lonicera macranthoides]
MDRKREKLLYEGDGIDGAGGKGTWGKLLDAGGKSHVDRNDPNHDSGELVLSTVSDRLDEYKKSVVSLIEEYFSTGDVEVAASDIKVLGSTRHADVIRSTQTSQGFVLLLESADDPAMDILDAVDIIHCLTGGVEGAVVPVLLFRRWRKIADRLRNMCCGGLWLEIHTAEPLILKLSKEAAEDGLISSSQMLNGFAQLAESLDDLALDIPSAKALVHRLRIGSKLQRERDHAYGPITYTRLPRKRADSLMLGRWDRAGCGARQG